VDGLLGVLVTAWQLGLLLVTQTYYESGRLHYIKPDALAVLLIAAQGLPLVWRRRRPLLVLVVVLLANTTYYALGYPLTGYDLALLIAVYSAAAYTSQRTSLLAASVTIGSFVVLYAFRVGPFWASAPFSLLGWLVVIFGGMWLWGRYVQVRRAYTAELEARAERAEHDREAEARRAVAAERARIARELHDVVAHHVSVSVVQAGAARQVLDSDPDRTRSALAAIEEAGRRALTAMPSLLRALRTDDADEARAPQPTLADVDDLVAGVTAAGLPVTLQVQGTRRPLPPGLDLSAYRIVQEALTNSLKHAGPAHAEVVLCYGPEALELRVVDDGQGLESAFGRYPSDSDRQVRRSGHGLVGMRERVALFGGELHAGARPEGGYQVVARLPLGTGSLAEEGAGP
jgi:signal transduction histidine kinase